jgi:hypothetical protein
MGRARFELHGLLPVGRRLLAVAAGAVNQAASLVGVLGVEPDRFGQIVQGFVELALPTIGLAAVGVSERVAGTQPQGLAQVGQGTVEVFFADPGGAADPVGPAPFGIEFQGGIAVSNGPIEETFHPVAFGPLDQAEHMVWIALQHLGTIRQGEVEGTQASMCQGSPGVRLHVLGIEPECCRQIGDGLFVLLCGDRLPAMLHESGDAVLRL